MIELKKLFNKVKDEKSGEITIEAMLVTIPTIFVLLFLLSLGFLLYQHWNMQVAVDDATGKIAGTYSVYEANNRTGEVLEDDYTKIAPYRALPMKAEQYAVKCEKRIKSYLGKRLYLTSFANPAGEPDIKCEINSVGYARKVLKVKATARFRIPFSEGLELFGMSGYRTYTATSSADCADMLDYINAIQFAKVAPNYIDSSVADAITSWMKVIEDITTFNNDD